MHKLSLQKTRMRIRNRPHNLLPKNKKRKTHQKRGENIYKKTSITTEAKQIKQFIENNKKIPKSCKLDNGIVLSPYSVTYLMSMMIKDKFKRTDYSLSAVVMYNTQRYADTINEKVYLEDYLSMISNFLKYYNDNRRVPAYITTSTSKTKVSFELYMYCMSKIVVYYHNHNTLPKYCLFDKADVQNAKSNITNNTKPANSSTSNCTNPYKSVPYNNKSGCDAMGQNTGYWCGVSALQKVLYKFGIHVSQKTLAEVSGTTTNGVGHQGLRTAIAWVSKKYNVKLTVQEYNFSELGIEKIAKMICKPNIDAIWHVNYKNRYGHYEKVKSIDLKNNTLEVVNSLGNKCGKCYCGYVEKRSLATQKQYISGISQKSIIIITKG